VTESVFALACARAPEGMEISAVAAVQPGRIALWSDQGTMSFAELNAQANRLVRRMRAAGLAAGDAVALVCGNRSEFAVVRFASHRAGLRLTPINWHLAPEDIRYIVENAEAKALFLDTRVAAVAPGCAQIPRLRLRVAIGGELPDYTRWADALDGMDGSDIPDPSLGATMLYTSGTTGRPKGVYRPPLEPGHAAQLQQMLTAVFQFDPESGTDRALATGPLYHTGPFALCFTTPLTAGIGAVIMDKWEPQRMLALIAQHRITHTFCVPTMFNRLLQLPDEVRARHDVSSLRFVIHGAAPCAVDVKKRMLDWWGPILWEMFAGTEGPGTIVSPQEWLAKPGTVGRPAPGQLRILDDAGNEVAPGQAGTIYLLNPERQRFRVLQGSGKDRLGAARRLFHRRRHRLPRRRRLPVPQRAQRGGDHLRRREHLSAGDRRRARAAPRGRRRGLRRRAERGSRRGDQGRSRAASRLHARCGAQAVPHGLLRRTPREAEMAAQHRLRRGAAALGGRQGAAPRAARALLGRSRTPDLSTRVTPIRAGPPRATACLS
jgi:long-chain acyl-CoA synthetase